MDSFQRTLTKTIVWRVIATVITLITVYGFTGQFNKATTITLTAAALLAAGYYVHERVWEKVEWGRHKVATIRSEEFERGE
ncbi:MAG TPA: DUF2061 domain-containing protein [Candidatus Paceibacterota bacterium]|nr:DUF2061 domain-containing protein [Candidatus Paceibacterota bacterium]